MTLLYPFVRRGALLASLGLAALPISGQTTATKAPPPRAQSDSAPPQQAQPVPSHGKVLYQRHADDSQEQSAAPETPAKDEQAAGEPQLTDADRTAIAISSYDLDLRLTPAKSGLNGRARLTVINTGDTPLPRIALQISSSLKWQSATMQIPGGASGVRLALAQHRLDTDADHTGQTSEAILTLPAPLAPGASLLLDLFYSGVVEANGGRLQRLGATPEQARSTDWDAITSEGIALRGLGNVLWFPVAAPQLFLTDGTLVPAIGKMRLQGAASRIQLRLRVDYAGEAPVAAYFCGRRQALRPLHDDENAPVAYGTGIATAEFTAEPIGVRPLSLFVLNAPEQMIAALPTPASKRPAGGGSSSSAAAGGDLSSSEGRSPMLAVESTDQGALAPLAASAERIAPLLQEWLGPRPLSALTIIDHSGQPFEDGPLLVVPVASLAASTAAPALTQSLAHAWLQTGQPWMDEGLGEFFALLWTEREKGRDAALAQLDALMQPVAAADSPAEAPESGTSENVTSSSSTSAAESGQPLIGAYDELFVRRKAAAVWWMLRDIAGEQPLQLALSAWRTQPASHDAPAARAQDFEHVLEKTSGKDLGWFFNDWVLHDRGLPSLSLVDVTPRQLPAGAGHDSGWLVAVTMRNAGGAGAEVPLVVRSGSFSTTKRVRIPGGATVTERVVVEAVPTEVVLNDGSTPETGPSIHTRTLVSRTQ